MPNLMPSPDSDAEAVTSAARIAAQPKVGIKIRHARKVREMTLRALAAKVGCSVSALSKIENQKANPSITMLHRICSALDSNLALLFSGEDDFAVVTRSGDRPVIETDQLRLGTGHSLERIAPNVPGHLLQGNIHVIEPGGSSDVDLQHGGEELGYVIEGSLELTVDGIAHLARAGDSFFFRSDLPHSYRNPGKTTTRVVWVNTPPTF